MLRHCLLKLDVRDIRKHFDVLLHGFLYMVNVTLLDTSLDLLPGDLGINVGEVAAVNDSSISTVSANMT